MIFLKRNAPLFVANFSVAKLASLWRGVLVFPPSCQKAFLFSTFCCLGWFRNLVIYIAPRASPCLGGWMGGFNVFCIFYLVFPIQNKPETKKQQNQMF